MILSNLFFAFLYIGAFSFGGGYAAMPLIQAQVIDKYGWMSLEQFTDLVTIAEMTPGPIAINAATFVGNQVAGIPGSLVATLGCILPSLFVVTFLAWLYQKYGKLEILKTVLVSLRPAVISAIAVSGISILISAITIAGVNLPLIEKIRLPETIFFIVAIYMLRKKDINPILVLVIMGGVEVVFRGFIMA